MSFEDININDISIDDIDFTDLEEQYQIKDTIKFDNYVVVDGAPIAPEAKAPVLTRVLTKLFSSAGKVVDMNLPIEDGKTKGYLFVEFDSVASAQKAIKTLNGKQLDVKHKLFLNRLSDIEKYGEKLNTEYTDPVVPEFAETDYLKSWIQDVAGRDQFVLGKGEFTGIFWNRHQHQPENVIDPRKAWSNNAVKFSPKGTFLFSTHDQGVVSWGGRKFDQIKRYLHPNVRALDVSPNEKFLVTFSPEPLRVSEDMPESQLLPADCNGHHIAVWDILSGLCVKTFALPPNFDKSKSSWPLIKWSYDDKYCARVGPNALAVYETQNNFQLLDGKVIKIEDLRDFEWAPTGVDLAVNRKNDPQSHILSYWTPETNNQPARVCVFDISNKRVLKSINLVQVSDVKMHWQSKSEILAVKVDRHTKSKKTVFTNLEFFKVTEKELPVEKLELKDRVINFQWEPQGDRFVTISKAEAAGDNPAIPKNVISFYAPETTKNGKPLEVKKWKSFYTITDKHTNTISWSPIGRFLTLATVVYPGFPTNEGELEFFDYDFSGDRNLNTETNVDASLQSINKIKYFGLTNLQWDPSGRYLTAWSSSFTHKLENGYKVYDLSGRVIREEGIDQFNTFIWRPRPDSLLTSSDKKKVRKNLKEYSAQFDELDAMEADAATRDMILKRRALLEAWNEYRQDVLDKVGDQLAEVLIEDEDETIEEIKEEILEEKEEVVDSF